MGLKILSCGAGMQSTALALISCAQVDGPVEHPEVPRYDAVIYCDLGIEPEWVARQVAFLENACTRQGIPFYILKSDLYQDYMENFGVRRVAGMPFWTLDEDGKAGKLHRRACTIEYKILMIQKFVRYRLLGYQPYQRLARKDIGAHELHIGFSYEEANRSFPSHHKMFKNRFPLIEMKWQRKDTYAYNLDVWGLDTRGLYHWEVRHGTTNRQTDPGGPGKALRSGRPGMEAAKGISPGDARHRRPLNSHANSSGAVQTFPSGLRWMGFIDICLPFRCWRRK